MEQDLDVIYHRQLNILNPENINKSVGIIGVGGIGSPTALALIKMGMPDITIYDNDKVELHNLPNQLYRVGDKGTSKVLALGNLLQEFAFDKQEITGIETKWNDECCPIKDIMICAVDSMDTRIAIWKKIKNSACELYIDARMGAELMRIYAINPQDPLDINFYEKTLYPSSEASQLPCSARAIFYNVFIIAGLIGSEVKKFLKCEKNTKEIIFDLSSLYFSSITEL